MFPVCVPASYRTAADFVATRCGIRTPPPLTFDFFQKDRQLSQVGSAGANGGDYRWLSVILSGDCRLADRCGLGASCSRRKTFDVFQKDRQLSQVQLVGDSPAVVVDCVHDARASAQGGPGALPLRR
jgi:hypothetical protein